MTSPLAHQLNPPAWQRSLAGFGYRQMVPTKVLAPYVQHYWELLLPAGQGMEHRELLHPDGGSSLLFQLQGHLSVDAQAAQQGVIFNPAAARSGELVLEPGVQVFAVRFHPGMGAVFWRAAASDFASELMGRDCAQYLRFDLPAVTEQLHMAADMQARVALLETALCGALAQGARVSSALPQALERLREGRGQQPLLQTLASSGLGQRQLERLCKRYLGLTAKQYSRLHRVAYSRELLKRCNPDPLAEVAYQAGYADQAHFSHDFKAVVGVTPGQYLRRVQARYHDVEGGDAQIVHRA
ncbi:AraC family transcriptional regulator [Halopseudomonas maritima]|uniref:AraC family transcriptional regulator n=1 Tax=Halopseudomonas maritima TaxID=2918528 RepID=UPI001EEA81E7|nr:helix-turn-helix domain-containing protein [Halopseudomonas maritima]UJJ30444.1 helix-turn-helix domain-containing protein [Halopseudomonas maritima]